jgi:hypothetical protein
MRMSAIAPLLYLIYRMDKSCAVDMFPQMVHVECVIGMQRKDT